VPSVHLVWRGRRSGTTRGGPVRELYARPAKAERCCLCHSPALRPWIAVFGVLRGGELEPGALAASGKSQAKAAGNSAANSACAKRRGAFLS